MTNLDLAQWRPHSDFTTPPNEPPEITALWQRASAAMERADRADGLDFQDRRTRRESIEEVYATLRQLRILGKIETKKGATKLAHHKRMKGRPHIFGKPMILTAHG